MPANCPETLRDPFYKTRCYGCDSNRDGFCTFYCPPWSARVPITSILTTGEQLDEYELRIARLEEQLSAISPKKLVSLEFDRQLRDMRQDIGRIYKLVEHRPVSDAQKPRGRKVMKTTEL